jgi:hypothetical protein
MIFNQNESMDKDLEKILERSKRNDPKPEATKAPEKVFPKNGPYDYLVFTKLVPWAGFQKVIFLLIIPAMISVGFLFEEMRQIVLYIMFGYAALVSLSLGINFLRYRFAFIGWQERLPFELKGWNEIIHTKKMFCDLCWNHARIEVVLKESSGQLEELVQASLKLFANRSKKAFYERDMGAFAKHHRQDWKITSPTIAEGSANPEVMRYMKNLFQNELSTIATKTGMIDAVHVTLTSEEFQIKIHIYNGD